MRGWANGRRCPGPPGVLFFLIGVEGRLPPTGQEKHRRWRWIDILPGRQMGEPMGLKSDAMQIPQARSGEGLSV